MKVCENCGVSFVQRRCPSGRLEDPKRFAARIFCSTKCSNLQKIGRTKYDPSILQRLREMAPTTSASKMGEALNMSRNTIIGLARRNDIPLTAHRVTTEQRLEKRAQYERDRRHRISLERMPTPSRIRVKTHNYRRPGRLVARMLWSGYVP